MSQWDGLKRLGLGLVGGLLGIGFHLMPVLAQTDRPSSVTAEDLDLSPEIVEESPVLQRWLEEVPDVLEDIRSDPSFRTRVGWDIPNFLRQMMPADLMWDWRICFLAARVCP